MNFFMINSIEVAAICVFLNEEIFSFMKVRNLNSIFRQSFQNVLSKLIV